MLIYEMFNPTPDGYYDERQDNSPPTQLSTRKTKLTLAHINQLRMMNDVRKLEHEKKMKTISKQYAPQQPAGGGFGM